MIIKANHFYKPREVEIETMRYCFFWALIIVVIFSACLDTPKKDERPLIDNPVITELGKKIKESPNDPTYYALRAGAYQELGYLDEAIQDLEKALTIDSTDIEWHSELAGMYYDNEEDSMVFLTLERAVDILPKNVFLHLKKAEFEYLLNAPEASIQSAEKVLQLDSKQADAHYIIGLNKKEKEDWASAKRAFQQAIKINPKHLDAIVELATIFKELGEDQALSYYDKALALDSTNVNAILAKADFHRDQQDWEKALGLYRKAGILEPQNEGAFLESGKVYLEMEEFKKADIAFNIVIQNYPQGAEGYYYKGLAKLGLGDSGKAALYFDQALRLDEGLEEARIALQKINEQ